MTPAQTLFLLIVVSIETVIAGLIGHRKGRTILGVILGILLGVIGIIIILCFKPTRDEMVRREREKLSIQSEARNV
jgi:predicted membrane channel-forming protein YqfA (hemolysin III family)